MPLKAIIFDFDGVLADTMQIHLESEQRIFEKLGLKISKGELAEFFGMKVSEFIKTVLKEKGLKGDWRELLKEKYAVMEELIEQKGVKAIPSIVEFVKKVKRKNLRLAIASGSRKKFINSVLKKIGLMDCFQVVLGEEDVQKGKPNAEIFLKCAELLGVKPGECLVIEDAENGIIAAKKAGMKVIALKSEFSGKQDLSKADKVINTFGGFELKSVLKWFD